MLLAIRAPPGSTLEIPSEIEIKQMHALALKNKDEYINMKSNNHDHILNEGGIQREEYEDLLNYLSMKYQIFINATKA